jgi:protein-disulfide isomerase
LTLLSSVTVFARSEAKVEGNIVDYVKRAINVNKDFQLKDVRIRQSKVLEKLPQWKVYFLDIDLKMMSKEKKGELMTVHDKIFSNGTFIVRDFINIVNKASLKDKIAADLDDSFYKADHLLYGNADAKMKIVVFSDPICPFCQTYMPELIKAAKENPDKIALYYYHFPLTLLHKEAPALIRTILVAEKKGIKNVVEKVYHSKFALNTADETKILEAFNKALGTHITAAEINAPEIVAHYDNDIKSADKLMISGTPTVYVNGKKDFSRNKYKTVIGK